MTSGGDDIRLRSYVNHYIWAHENAVDYRLDLGLGPGLRLPYDAKYAIIRRSLMRHDWVMWVDDDVYFTRWDAAGVEALMSRADAQDKFLVIAEGPVEPTGIWSRINSGVMLLRNDPRTHRLLDLAQEVDVPALVDTWDFARDGLFSGGDQDALWHTLTTNHELMAGIEVVGHAQLNSRPHLLTGAFDAVLNVHFCGPHKESRIQDFARQHGLGLELVPGLLLDKYSVKRREAPRLRTYVPLRVAREADRSTARIRRKVRFIRRERRWR